MQTAFRAGALTAIVLSSLSATSIAVAGPADYVVTPIVEEGEREIDFKAGVAKTRDGSGESAYSLGFGWGAKSWWFTELYAKWHKVPGAGNTFDAWE